MGRKRLTGRPHAPPKETRTDTKIGTDTGIEKQVKKVLTDQERKDRARRIRNRVLMALGLGGVAIIAVIIAVAIPMMGGGDEAEVSSPPQPASGAVTEPEAGVQNPSTGSGEANPPSSGVVNPPAETGGETGAGTGEQTGAGGSAIPAPDFTFRDAEEFSRILFKTGTTVPAEFVGKTVRISAFVTRGAPFYEFWNTKSGEGTGFGGGTEIRCEKYPPGDPQVGERVSVQGTFTEVNGGGSVRIFLRNCILVP